VLEALFSSEQDEQDVLDKYKVSRKLFNRWMSEDNFAEQLNQYSAGAYRRSALHLARFAPRAADRLVRLTESEKGETARKACLDIISMGAPGNGPVPVLATPPTEHPQLPSETASELLAVLAQKKRAADGLPLSLRGQSCCTSGP
jgi:hypothetical protein